MAHRSTIVSIWTTVLAALVALFAGLGFGAKAAAAASPAVAPVGAGTVVPTVRRPALMARRTWRAMMRGGSLPPTIKQRIRAEAHGKTPSVRRSTTAAALAADSRSTRDAELASALGARAAARREMALAA